MSRVDELITFWFGDLDENGAVAPEVVRRWWTRDEAFDETIRRRFTDLLDRMAAGDLEDWRQTPRGTLAYVLVADQLSRNAFRGTPRMYATDLAALRATHDALEAGLDQALPLHHRAFLYMPLMHSERLEDQTRCVALFEALADAPPPAGPAFAGSADFARQHRDIVARFGRFPHRNAILGRASTPEELAFLEQPGSSF